MVTVAGCAAPSSLAATSRMPSRMVSTALMAALPFRSVVALAALGDMLAIRVVLVLSTRTRRREMPKVRATTDATLLLMPWPISMPPVVTLTLPSA